VGCPKALPDIVTMLNSFVHSLVAIDCVPKKKSEKAKTYNSRYSLMVTHSTTNLPICSLCKGERTGSPVLCNLWSYVKDICLNLSISRCLARNIVRTMASLPLSLAAKRCHAIPSQEQNNLKRITKFGI
jgi:hypothetical protein